MSAFDIALKLVLQMEGGRVDNPKDPGGRTNAGVTQRVYDAWRIKQGLPRRDVYLATLAEESAIYRHQYADPIRFDDLPPPVAYAVFDDAVNSGVSEAAKELQRALGCKADGAIGLLTLQACSGVNDLEGLVDKLCDARLSFLRRLKAFLTFGKGWKNRVAFVRAQAKRMAAPNAFGGKGAALTS